MKKIFALAFITALLTLSVLATENAKITRMNGIADLGNTKEQVLKAFGSPDSPPKYDFYYEKPDTEVIIVFNENTKLVQSIIIRGKNAKYSVNNVTVGSTKTQVKTAFGAPEKKYSYIKSGAECWFYPSKNVGFAFHGDSVASFSVNDFQY